MVGLSIRALLIVPCFAAVPGARADAPSLLSWQWMEQASRKDVAGLLDRGADIDARTERGDTPLHRAARSNENPAVVALLLGRGAAPSSRDAEGRFPADLAEDNDAIRGFDVYRRLNDGRF